MRGLPALAVLTAGCVSTEPPTLYQVQRTDFRREVTAEGVLRATEATPVTPPRGVRRALEIVWLVEDGSFVREGELIARFDPTEIESELLEGEIGVATVEHQSAQREVRKSSTLTQLERDRRVAELELRMATEFGMKDPDIFSRSEIIESRLDRELAEVKLEHAERSAETEEGLAGTDLRLLAIEGGLSKARVERANEALAALEVRAPHDGIVLLRRDWRGDTVEVGSTTYGGHAFAELPDLSEMEAAVYVLEADASGLEVGAPARVVLESDPGREIGATIRHIDRVPKPRLRGVPVQYFEVALALDEPESAARRPGQRVRATLALSGKEDVIVVPRQAVRREEGSTFVYRWAEGRAVRAAVQLGPTSLGRIVVESGLEEGDVIVLSDPDRSYRELVPPPGEDASEGVAP